MMYAQLLFDYDIEKAYEKIVYRLLKDCMKEDLIYSIRRTTKYNSNTTFYVYLFLRRT